MREKLIEPTSASLAVTLRCNSRCVICDIWKRKNRQELSPVIYKKLPQGLKNIDITGGEPFLRNDLVKIVEVVKKTCPKARILVTTNGSMPLKIAKTSQKMLKFDKNLAFRVSLDGIGKTHDKIRGVINSYKKTVDTIRILKELNVKDLGIIFTLSKLNQDELPKVLDFCKQEKLQFSLNLVHSSPVYFGNKKTNLRPSLKEIEKNLGLVSKFFIPSLTPKNWAKAWFYKKIVEYVKTGKRTIRCGAGENFFYLDPFGDVYICHFKDWKIGNLRKQSFEEIWQGDRKRKFLKLARKCHGCFMICTAKDEIKKQPFLILR